MPKTVSTGLVITPIGGAVEKCTNVPSFTGLPFISDTIEPMASENVPFWLSTGGGEGLVFIDFGLPATVNLISATRDTP